MLSISNDGESVADRILDAAATCALASGVRRVTLAEIARRAGVSRPTVYRRFPDTRSILAAVLTMRVGHALDHVPSGGVGRVHVVARVVAVTERLRADDVVMTVLHDAPELAMTYLSERLGTSQQLLLDVVTAELQAAQDEGSVRRGDPRELAALLLLVAQSTILSAPVVAPVLGPDALARELAHCLNGYLVP